MLLEATTPGPKLHEDRSFFVGDLSLCISSSGCCFSSFNILCNNTVVKSGNWFPGFCEPLHKLRMRSWEPLLHSQLIGSAGDNLDLQLASEVGGAALWCWALTCGIWRYIQDASVWVQLNCRTPRWPFELLGGGGKSSCIGIGCRILKRIC